MPHRHPALWAAAFALLLALVSVFGARIWGMSLSTRDALTIAILCVLVIGVILGTMRYHGRL